LHSHFPFKSLSISRRYIFNLKKIKMIRTFVFPFFLSIFPGSSNPSVITTALMSDGQLRRKRFPKSQKAMAPIESPNEAGRQVERACHSYSEFTLATECGPYRKSRAAAVPIAMATQELAKGRFGMQTGNQGRRKRLQMNNASDLTKNNKNYIL